MDSDNAVTWSRELIAGCLQRRGPIEPVQEPNLTPAAVLLALIERPQGLHVLLTRRTEHLRDHAGQISFPGGRIEPEDGSAEAAALREAHEEVGLPPTSVEVIGRLPTYTIRTGYLVHPVVGMVQPPLQLVPDPFEVAEIFEVPLAFFLDPANHQFKIMQYEGRQYPVYAMPYKHYYIWGATAAILREFYLTLTRA